MRVIFLNLDHGRKGQPLFDFLSSNSASTDIFCFQEATDFILNKAKKLLPQFDVFGIDKKISEDEVYAVASFVNQKYLSENKQKIFEGLHGGLSMAFTILCNPNKIRIFNVHGIPQPGDKRDNEARIKQSKNIIESASKVNLPRIIGGDFNLLSDTTSIEIFEKAGYRNLIKDFKIKTTRSKNAWKVAFERNAPNMPFYEKQDFADYCFVSPEIKVTNFEVPNIEISDHLPLILDFEI